MKRKATTKTASRKSPTPKSMATSPIKATTKSSAKSTGKVAARTTTRLATSTSSEPLGDFAPKKVCIMYRPQTLEAVKQARELAGWLVEQDLEVVAAVGQDLGHSFAKLTPADLDSVDWVVVLGGDGTYLGAVRMLEGRQTPILGVNMGSLGFLTETRLEDLYKAVISTLRGEMEFRRRSMLKVEVRRKGKAVSEHLALNDVVLERGSYTHLINIEIHSAGHLVGVVKADALIAASPTGSTAYNLAAGGPILHPEVRAIVVTPVCPHALTSRPLIFPDDQKLSFRVVNRDKRAILTVDGIGRGEITPDDEVVVVRSATDHFVIRKTSANYFSLLREKLNFGQRA